MEKEELLLLFLSRLLKKVSRAARADEGMFLEKFVVSNKMDTAAYLNSSFAPR